MSETNYLELPERIKRIYNDCTPEEQSTLITILEEIGETGTSPTYENIWLQDYKEIPVDKYTFLTDPEFLGDTNNNGASIYPAWMDTMLELERTGNQYFEIALTGATRTGKTTTAVADALYHLYRIMCLKDPQSYFGLKSITNISFFFFNITQTLAKSVAFKEFNTSVANSKWFMRHGKMSKSEVNPTYIPEGGLISIEYGSDASHALGRATFCVDGDTEILTDTGFHKIKELENQVVNVGQYHDNHIEYCYAKVICTKLVRKQIKLETCAGSIIVGTPEHRIAVDSVHYKRLDEFEVGDDIWERYDNKWQIGEISNVAYIYYEDSTPVYDVTNVVPYHNFIVRSNDNLLVAHNCVIFDECNFAAAGIKDVNKAKERMKEKYDTLVARVTGTFVKHGEVFGRLYIISSKRSDSDFMEEYIQNQKNAGNQHMYVFDKPQWEVWPKSRYSSDEIFYVALGGKHKQNFVVQDESEEALQELREQGYELMKVPMDNKVRFIADLDVALRDIAGIAVAGAMSFITQDVLDNCIGTRKNPFYQDILQIGVKDSYFIEEFFHMEEIERPKQYPLYVDVDLSLNDDKTGVSGVWLVGRNDIENEAGVKVSLPTFKHAFTVSIKAPKGDKIPYMKVKSFLLWLRKNFDLERVSRDQFQSEYLAQVLESEGITVDKLSVDRTPDGYIALRNVFIEQRIDLLHVDLLEQELTRLERDPITGKVDHPAGGCFTEDTKVILSDCREASISELLLEQEYKQNYVFTVNESTLNIETKPIKKVFYTKSVSELVEITLNTGERIQCTPDHKFMTYDGSYVEAQYLCEGIRLMPYHIDDDLTDRRVKLKIVAKSVKFIHHSCKVYDIEVEDNHNFLLAAGVFVHNSKDQSDSLARCVWNAILHDEGVKVSSSSKAKAISAVNGLRSIHNSKVPTRKDELGMFPQYKKFK